MDLWFYDEIGPLHDWGQISARSVAEVIEGDLRIHVNSPGGDVFEAIAIRNILARHDGEIRIVVDSLAASAATIFWPPKAEVEMALGAYLMIHNPYTAVVGDAEELEAKAALLRRIKTDVVDYYVQRSGTATEEKISELMDGDGDKQTWLDSSQALELGLVDEIGEAQAVAANFGRLVIGNVSPEIRQKLERYKGVRLAESPLSEYRRERVKQRMLGDLETSQRWRQLTDIRRRVDLSPRKN